LRPLIQHDRALAAYHEAGHAVARLVSGNPVRGITLAEDGTGGTRYLYRRGCLTPITDAICCLAGPVAEAAAAGRPLAEVLAGGEGSADLDMARAALAQDASRTTLGTAAALAADLVREHAAAVKAVANALLDRGGVLDGDTLAATILRVAARL
jgi:hypothetical protein